MNNHINRTYPHLSGLSGVNDANKVLSIKPIKESSMKNLKLRIRTKSNTGQIHTLYYSLPVFLNKKLWADEYEFLTMDVFSALTDKNEKDIYAGDLIANKDGKPMLVQFGEFTAGKDDWGVDFKAIGWHIVFHSGGAYAITQNSDGYCIKANDCEIVGNIYETA